MIHPLISSFIRLTGIHGTTTVFPGCGEEPRGQRTSVLLSGGFSFSQSRRQAMGKQTVGS